MKFAPLAIAATLALGTAAFAQSDRADAPRQGDTIGQKADRLFDRAENATKRGVDKVRGGAHHAKKEAKEESREARADRDMHDKHDTRAMGAGRADHARRDAAAPAMPSGDRQSRMDDAYANWKSQHKQ